MGRILQIMDLRENNRYSQLPITRRRKGPEKNVEIARCRVNEGMVSMENIFEKEQAAKRKRQLEIF